MATAVASGLSLVATSVVALVLMTGPAAADTTSSTQSFTTAGTYTVTVPTNAISITLDGLGGAGFPGDGSSSGSSAGGAAGSGTQVHEVLSTAHVAPGDRLQVVVGAKGGGGQRGYGSELSGAGGNGGGATYVKDLTANTLLLVAGGGGGGGGGGGTFVGYTGGNGGTNGAGTPGLGAFGSPAGRGGAEGQAGTCGSSGISQGGTGESAPSASAVAGGGGGGGGACGGQSGGSGDHGSGAPGAGGGGGSGASLTSPFASSPTVSAGTNAADGSASITFALVNYTSTVTATPDPVHEDNTITVTASPILDNGVPVTDGAAFIYIGPQGTLPITSCTEALVSAPMTCSVHLTSGQDPTGFYQAVVAYDSPGGTLWAAGSTTFGVVAAYRPTTTKLTASSPITAGGGTLTATVAPTSAGALIPTGTVSFSDGSTPLCGGPIALTEAADHTDGVATCHVGPTTSGTHHYTATYSGDSTFAGSTGTLDATIASALAVSTTSLPAGQVGSAYSAKLTASGGTSPYAWSVSSGQLPAGLVLHSDGTITGTPTVPGAANFTVQASDSATPAQTAQEQLSLQVKPAPATAPGPPMGVAATAGNASASVSFAAPANDGGDPITGYTVTAHDQTTPGNGGQTAHGSASPITIKGLTNGDRYTFTVTATSAAGSSQASTASNVVTPHVPVNLADLHATITGPSHAADGTTFSETIKVLNAGPSPATRVITGLVVPRSLRVASLGGGSRFGRAVYWTEGSIAPYATATYVISFKVAPHARGRARIAAAAVSTRVKDPNYGNNTAVTTVTLGSPRPTGSGRTVHSERLGHRNDLTARLKRHGLISPSRVPAPPDLRRYR